MSTHKKEKKILSGRPLTPPSDRIEQTCAHCGIVFYTSQFGYLATALMKHKPACSLACNIALGQVKPPSS